jgi:hypothetical protein
MALVEVSFGVVESVAAKKWDSSSRPGSVNNSKRWMRHGGHGGYGRVCRSAMQG